MKILVLNGSPRPTGSVSSLLRDVADAAEAGGAEVRWVDAYRQQVAPCSGCMRCRATGRCCLPEDDGHRVGQAIREADALVVGSPVHWANISSPLKALLDRNVPAFVGESSSGMPSPRLKGRPVVLTVACTTPAWLDAFAGQSRGALRALREPLALAGCRVRGTLVRAGSRGASGVPARLRARAQRLGRVLATGR